MNADDGQWHHFAAVYDGTVKIIYWDGYFNASEAESVNIATTTWDLSIGNNVRLPERAWKGWLDDVRLYDDALTLEEVVYIMTGSTDPMYFDLYSPANLTNAGDPCESRFVNFKDFDILADNWLTELLWPSGW